MAIFNRKPKNQKTLPEVEQYYTAERRERAGLAWVLAVVSIFVVALIIVGLFFGGRWVYRSATKKDDNPVATTDDTGSSTTVDGGPSATTTPSTGSKPGSTGTGSNGNTGSTTAPSTTTPSTSAPTGSAATNTPSTTNNGLPNTGPGNTTIIFVVTGVTAAAGHYVYQKRKSVR